MIGHDVDAGFGEIAALPLRLFQDRAHAHDQGQFAVGFGEGEADGAGAGLFGGCDLGPCAVVAGVAGGAERLVGPDHILDRDRAAVGEARLGAEGEGDPGAVRVGLDQFGQKTVEGEGFVPVPAHQALIGEEAKLPGHPSLEDVRIERIEASDLALNDPAALGRVRICVGQ